MFLLLILGFFGLLDGFPSIDLILSHRLHYIHLMLEPSVLGSVNASILDSSYMTLLNMGGMLAFLLYLYASYRVMKVSRESAVLVLSFMLIGLAENIINQYHIMAPFIFLIYFSSLSKISFKKGNV